MSAPAPTVLPELKAQLRRVKLSRLLDTLPERLAWPLNIGGMGHAEFLEPIVERQRSAATVVTANREPGRVDRPDSRLTPGSIRQSTACSPRPTN